jgi:c-di-GMP-binding flagellar brake protein YcgR
MNTEIEQTRKQLEDLIGSKVELAITSGLYKGTYAARLEELENNLIGVSHPMVRGGLLPALRSTELLMKIEASSCFYQATASVVRSTANAVVPVLWLKLVVPLEKVQRRMFVRVSSTLKGEAFFLSFDEEPPEGVEISLPPKQWFPVRISDISLGGAGIVVKANMAQYFLEGGRYLLRASIGGKAFFTVGKLVKILKKTEAQLEAGLGYESLAAFTEKLMGGYIRQQELITRG